MRERVRTGGRWLLAVFLTFAGVGHFVSTDSFRAQIPPWMPAPEMVIWVSGVVEIAFALALLFAPPHRRALVGWLTAGLFVAVFPGNISQFVTGTDGFGLETDAARGIRLLFQPVLVIWALWCTGAWAARANWPDRHRRSWRSPGRTDPHRDR